MDYYYDNLLIYLKSIDFKPLPKKNKELTPRYIVLYKYRQLHTEPEWFVYHNVNTYQNCLDMLNWEIYGSARMVDLHTFTTIERDHNSIKKLNPLWQPHPWEFDYWKKQKITE